MYSTSQTAMETSENKKKRWLSEVFRTSLLSILLFERKVVFYYFNKGEVWRPINGFYIPLSIA